MGLLIWVLRTDHNIGREKKLDIHIKLNFKTKIGNVTQYMVDTWPGLINETGKKRQWHHKRGKTHKPNFQGY